MNIDKLHAKLVVAARQQPVDDRVPYAFPVRVMACIRSAGAEDPWLNLSRLLWRAAAPCIAISVLLSVWSVLDPGAGSDTPDFAQQFEETVLADAQQTAEGETLW